MVGQRSKTLECCPIRKDDQIIKAGDTVLMRAPNPEIPPYVARVEKIMTYARNRVKLLVRWYYRPEECHGGRQPFYGSKEVLLSDHWDMQKLETVMDKCVVHTFKEYTELAQVGDEDYYCRLEYTPMGSPKFKPQEIDV